MSSKTANPVMRSAAWRISLWATLAFAVGAEFIWYFSACKLCDFSHYPTVEAVLGCPPGYVAEDRNLSSEPCVTPTLNVVRYEAMKHDKNQHYSNGKCKRCPKRNTPCGAPHDGISGL